VKPVAPLLAGKLVHMQMGEFTATRQLHVGSGWQAFVGNAMQKPGVPDPPSEGPTPAYMTKQY
jgi:hypothetical protein